MLELQYFGHWMEEQALCKRLMQGNIEGMRRRASGEQKMRWLNDIANSMDMSLSKCQEMVNDREALSVAILGVAKI